MNELAPIVLFTYNRPNHTFKTIEALKSNYLADKSNLYIFSDAPKSKDDIIKVKEVREYISNISGFKKIKIIKRKNNLGLAKSVIDGVSSIIKKYGNIIVLEDDLITSKYFLTFLNDSLNKHTQNKKICSITGYSFPINIPSDYKFDVYIFYRCMSWGWATWLDRWEKVDWNLTQINKLIKNSNFKEEFNRGGDDLFLMLKRQINGKIDSWAIRWCLSHYLTKSGCLYPINSLVKNIGFDGSGIHCGYDASFDSINLKDKKIDVNFNSIYDDKIVNQIQKIHVSKSLFQKILNKINSFIQINLNKKFNYKN